MRRLVGHQDVTIALGNGDENVDLIHCVVKRVRGAVATVAPCDAIATRLQSTMRTGALGFLTFDHYGAPIALRGAAQASSDGATIEFVVLDGVQVEERRRAPRVALKTPVRVASLADNLAGPIETVTANLSLVGALLKREPGLGTGPWQIELFLPGESTPVRGTASLARHSADHLGVAFADIEDADLIRIKKAVADQPQASAAAQANTRIFLPAAAVVAPSDHTGADFARDRDFELIVDSIPYIVFIASRYGSTEYFNQRGIDYMGLPREKTRGWAWTAMLHDDDVERVAAAWAEAAAGEAPYEIEYRLRRHDGEFRWHQARALPVRARDGEVVKWIGTLIDIDDQRRLEHSLRASERRAAASLSLLEALQASAPAGLGFVDRDFRVVHINEMLALANGAPREQQLGRTLAEVMPALWAHLEPTFRRVLETGDAVLDRETTRKLPVERGRVGTALTSFYPVRFEGEVIGIGIVVLDITERKQTEEALRNASERDPQTGAYNRLKLFAELERIVRDATEHHHPGALLMLDIDNFKHTNDTHGHTAGDQLLSAVAQLLMTTSPETTIIARIGGDEFAMVLPDTTEDQARTAANKLRTLLRKHATGPVTLSIGIAPFTGTEQLTAEDLLAAADTALYNAKAAGGDQATVHQGRPYHDVHRP